MVALLHVIIVALAVRSDALACLRVLCCFLDYYDYAEHGNESSLT